MRKLAPLLGIVLAWIAPGGGARGQSPAPASSRAATPAAAAADAPSRPPPRGQLSKFRLERSEVYPGTVRDYWVYVPAEYDAKKAACLWVFTDGEGYAKPDGQWQAPQVFDELIARREMPVTIGLFVNHGYTPTLDPKHHHRFNRSFEYDELGDRYARFLLGEVIPEVEKNWNVSRDPACRGIGGASSGAIAAFSAAWERPESFSRVFSTIGTYVNQREGDQYPALVRKTEAKPLRIFLHDGTRDQNGWGGSWWLANVGMLSALSYAGYEVNHLWDDGEHNARGGVRALPDALRWLWRDFPARPRAGVGSRQPVAEWLDPAEPWVLVSEGHKFTEGPSVNRKGEVFFTDIPNNRIYKVDLDGKVSLFAEGTDGANGLRFGIDGRLYACANGKQQLKAYDAAGKATVVAEAIGSNDIDIDRRGHMYVSDLDGKKLWHVAPDGTRTPYDPKIAAPNGVALSADQQYLFVADSQGRFVHSFQIQDDGSLKFGQPWCRLHLAPDATSSGADGLAVDRLGQLWVTSRAGLQICDTMGRPVGIVPKPAASRDKWLANVVFGGPKLDTLYVTIGDKVWKRKTKTAGVLSIDPPIETPRPRL